MSLSIQTTWSKIANDGLLFDLTLKFDLDAKQQNEVSALLLKQAKLRQSKKEAYLNSKAIEEKENRFKMANARLDRQIEMKKKMKDILSTDQYEKWGKLYERRATVAKGALRP